MICLFAWTSSVYLAFVTSFVNGTIPSSTRFRFEEGPLASGVLGGGYTCGSVDAEACDMLYGESGALALSMMVESSLYDVS